MAIRQLTSPTEIITTQDVHDHLRIDHNDEDGLLESLITAAREYVEKHLGIAIGSRTYKLTLDRFPCSYGDTPILIPRPPLISIDSISYFSPSGTETSLSVASVIVDVESKPGRISPIYGQSWPSVQDRMNSISIEFTAGYTAEINESAGEVHLIPTSLKQAMLLLIGHLYANREAAVEKSLSEVPMAVSSLLALNNFGMYP